MEMRLLLAKVVYSFNLTLVNKEVDWDRDTKIETFWRKPDLMVRFEKRSN
jgi:hypothetical protein